MCCAGFYPAVILPLMIVLTITSVETVRGVGGRGGTLCDTGMGVCWVPVLVVLVVLVVLAAVGGGQAEGSLEHDDVSSSKAVAAG